MKKELANFIPSLEEETLYSAGSLAARVFDPVSDTLNYRLLRRQLTQLTADYRDFPFEEGGQGIIRFRHKPVPAWYGYVWIEFLENYRQEQQLPTASGRDRDAQPLPNRLFHPAMVINRLSNFETYSRPEIRDLAEQWGYFEDCSPKVRSGLTKRLADYRAKGLPKQPDTLRLGKNNQEVGAWYGYSWKLALSDRVFKPAEKKLLRAEVAAWQRQQNLKRYRLHLPTKWVLRSLAALVPTLILAFTWILLPSQLEREQALVQGLKEDPSPERVQQARALLKSDRGALDKSLIARSLVQAVRGRPRYESIEILRDTLNVEGVDRAETIRAIAETNEHMGQLPLVVADFTRPVFLASFPENPVILYPEGHLRPGDWVELEGGLGFVKEIEADFIVFAAGEFAKVFEFPPVLAFGFRAEEFCNVKGWQGTGSNLNAILRTVATVNDYQYYPGSISIGHFSGYLSLKNYSDFIDFINSYSVVTERNGALVHNDFDNIKIIVARKDIMRKWSVEDFVNKLSEQTGIEIVMEQQSSVPLDTEMIVKSFNIEKQLQPLNLRWEVMFKAGGEPYILVSD